jgi:hypothetical protein
MQDAFAALHAETQAQARDLAAQVAEGSLTAAEFGEQMASLLTEAHTQAVMLGRHHAGDTAPEEADDRKFADLVMDGEAEFLSKFVADISAGRYQDEGGAWRVQGMQNRAGTYASKLVATAGEAWSLALPETTLFYWHLQDHSHACPECPDLALNSPYRQADLPAYPTAGETTCRANCRCWLTTSSGRRSLSIPD